MECFSKVAVGMYVNAAWNGLRMVGGGGGGTAHFGGKVSDRGNGIPSIDALF
jgi:hypothetical protein